MTNTNKSETVTVTVGDMNAERGIVVFEFRKGRRVLGAQEVTCTGDLRKDVGSAARWFLSRNLGITGGKLRPRKGGYTSLPYPALAAYGITRDSAPIGQASVEAPIFDVVTG